MWTDTGEKRKTHTWVSRSSLKALISHHKPKTGAGQCQQPMGKSRFAENLVKYVPESQFEKTRWKQQVYRPWFCPYIQCDSSQRHTTMIVMLNAANLNTAFSCSISSYWNSAVGPATETFPFIHPSIHVYALDCLLQGHIWRQTIIHTHMRTHEQFRFSHGRKQQNLGRSHADTGRTWADLT